jgi:hypothetical protein
VVDCANGDGPPPPELSLGWQCERFNCLPDVGAYKDQDYQTMVFMTAFMNVHSVVKRWKTLRGKQVHSLTDSERKILRYLKDLGVMF